LPQYAVHGTDRVSGDQRPILVVGAGPTGLTLACELARHGAPVRIVDKAPGIASQARATGLHSRTLEVFQQMGIVEPILAQGQRMAAMNQYLNGERIRRIEFAAIDSPFPFGVALEQWRTEQALEQLLGRYGLAVERGCELVALEDRLDGVRARLRRADGEEELLETPWLVGCDGAHSAVRHHNRDHFTGDADPTLYAIGDVMLDPPPAPAEVHVFLARTGAAMLFPLPEGRHLLMANVEPSVQESSEPPSAEELQELLVQRVPGAPRLKDPRWRSRFRIHYRLCRHYVHGRTLLAGDAVHVHSPFGGQGMNTGIQDAFNLAWKLALVARGRAPQVLLKSYEKERRGVAEEVIASTRAATEGVKALGEQAGSSEAPFERHAEMLIQEPVAAAEHREELDLDYRRSPICRQHLGRSPGAQAGPHAGAQARDAGPLLLDGERTSLFERMRDGRHLLLLFAGSERPGTGLQELGAIAREVERLHGDLITPHVVAAPGPGPGTEPARGTLLDLELALHRKFGVSGNCLYLIRPDGYIGFRSAPIHLVALRNYLDTLFLPAPVGLPRIA